MNLQNKIDGKTAYSIVLILGMISSVILFNTGYELISAGVITLAVISLAVIKRKSERPIFDERDNTLMEESTHLAVMWTGVFLGTAMIVIAAGMGLNIWDYPNWAAPYYLSWGVIMALSIVIEKLKRHKVIE